MEQNNLQLIPATPLRKLLGGISDMTLYRWMEAGTFPRPVVGGGKGHRYWRLIDVATWQEQNINKSEHQDVA
jgi:predicted DNA-binding transcriptional regulator AlpA